MHTHGIASNRANLCGPRLDTLIKHSRSYVDSAVCRMLADTRGAIVSVDARLHNVYSLPMDKYEHKNIKTIANGDGRRE